MRLMDWILHICCQASTSPHTPGNNASRAAKDAVTANCDKVSKLERSLGKLIETWHP